MAGSSCLCCSRFNSMQQGLVVGEVWGRGGCARFMFTGAYCWLFSATEGEGEVQSTAVAAVATGWTN